MKFTQILSIGLLSTIVHAAIQIMVMPYQALLVVLNLKKLLLGEIVKNVLGSGVLNNADVSLLLIYILF